MAAGRLGAVAGAALSLSLVGGAIAQVGERRIENAVRQTEPGGGERGSEETGSGTRTTLGERAFLDVGGFFTYSFLNLNDSLDNHRRLNQYDTTLYGRVSIEDAHQFFGRLRFRYRDFSPGDSFDGRGDNWAEPFADRYWYDFDLRNHVRAFGGERPWVDVGFRGGRQFVDWGAGLALSEVLYAARPTLTIGDRFTVEGLAGVTPGDESVVDFDASRVEYNRHTKRAFYGGMARYVFEGGQGVYAYGLHMADYNTDNRARFGVTDRDIDFDYDATYIGVGFDGSAWGDLQYLGEFVYETGRTASDPTRGAQRRDDISAFAARGQLTYLFRDEGLSRLQFETLFASGDKDRILASDTVGGNRPGTTDHGFNSLGFANTGLAFAPSLSNLMSYRLGASTFPFRRSGWFDKLQVGTDLLWFGKLESEGGFDEPTSTSTFLGFETDVYVNWRVASDVALGVRYGAFFPGGAITGERDTRHFVLLSATVSF